MLQLRLPSVAYPPLFTGPLFDLGMRVLSNPRHEQFARLVAAGETAAKAYTLAGYGDINAASSGSRLSKTAKVRSRIVELLEESARTAIKRVELNKDWVLAKLKENVERAMQAIPVLDSQGNPTGKYEWNGSVANSGLELIGKHLAMFRDTVDLSVKDDFATKQKSEVLAATFTLGELERMMDVAVKAAEAAPDRCLQTWKTPEQSRRAWAGSGQKRVRQLRSDPSACSGTHRDLPLGSGKGAARLQNRLAHPGKPVRRVEHTRIGPAYRTIFVHCTSEDRQFAGRYTQTHRGKY
jgi:phage terminase small subunit